ncbi:MAG: hypothetical protein HQL19_04820 [Candidatus Omnitrophica bacterium]|nr:hypothetical protein [Candidatus Omnitrophota bacterium]
MPRKSLLISLSIALLFLGIWFWLASSLSPFMDEPEHLGLGQRFATEHIKFWEIGRAQDLIIKETGRGPRGLVVTYLCSLACPLNNNTVLLSRLIPLFFVLLTFAAIIVYYRKQKILTASVLLTSTILFFGSFIVLDQALYIRPYALLGAIMMVVFILYWEGLLALRQQRIRNAVWLWLASLMLFSVTIADGWQYQQIPIMALGIGLSLIMFDQRFLPTIEWLRKHAVWFWLLILIIAPVFTIIINVVPIPLKGVPIVRWFATYWDNIISGTRFLLTMNIAILAIGYASDQKKPVSFARWMLITGFFSGIYCTLFNPSNQVIFPRYAYLPALMMLAGFAVILTDLFPKATVRRCLLAIYLLINLMLSVVNFYYERNNIAVAIRWLNTHLTQQDILLSFRPLLEYNHGRPLAPQVYRIEDTEDVAHVQALITYIEGHADGRIFYLLNDEYQVRDWLYKKTTGVTRDVDSDLYTYLKHRPLAKKVLPDLRTCGLLEYDRATLLAELKQLAVHGFEPPFKAPEKTWIKDRLHQLGLSKMIPPPPP